MAKLLYLCCQKGCRLMYDDYSHPEAMILAINTAGLAINAEE
jgi:hypothetical protein